MEQRTASGLPSVRRIGAGVSALLVALALSACTGNPGSAEGPTAPANPSPPADDAIPSPTTDDATGGTEAVTIHNFAFEPETVEVPVGTQVHWTNEDMFAHTVTSGGPDDPTGRFDADLGDLGSVEAAGTTFEHVFDEPGTYPYFCRFHPKMQGEVVVVP